MPTRNGKNFIVSVNVNRKMLDALNKRPKGTRSAFLRRAIYNANRYDVFVKAHQGMLDSRDKTILALLEVLRWKEYQQSAILMGETDQDYDSWRWGYVNGDPKSRVDHLDVWSDVYAAIDELTPHIDGLSNARHALEDMGGIINELED
jgi:hypothetical protein